ncbi:RagB/SusD family nutrient uptake outer membrane protein, partial [Arachidicoccus sp.]|uniref:RagB/SusD family nutrient uptake outer membrane protein n=1 Tax=Arachidicoccus sp. TaxID=1872624 RepID=UPI003D2348CD
SSDLGYTPTSTVAQMTGNDQSNDVFAYRNYRQLVVFNFLYSTGEQGLTNNGHIEYLTIAAPYSSKPLPDIYVPKETINAIYPDTMDQRFGIDTSTGLHRDAFFGNYYSNIPIFKKINVLTIAGDGGVTKALFYQSAIVFSRYEEVLLLRAEALSVLGKNSDALDILNGIRKDRGLNELTAQEVPDMIDAIFAERRRELIGEGWRWFDLIRYKKIKGNDPQFNAIIQDGGIYWPVSAQVLGANPNLVQTLHWK